MSYSTIIDLIFIFLIYSVFGWLLEVTVVAVKEGKFVNRGITNGPLCSIYGLSALIILLTTRDINNIPGIFLASVIYGTFIEFLVGKFLEKINKVKWWNYSKKRFNFDGYICLEYSILWGIIGVLVVYIVNPIMISSFHNINIFIRSIILFISFGIAILDLITSFITVRILDTAKLENISNRLGNFILSRTKRRIENAYPNTKKKKQENKKTEKFAEGINFHKLFILFLIGAFVGDLWEIVYCRYSMHRWMSRSSLVFGQLSIVWGMGIVLATISLHRYREKNRLFIFLIGSVLGAAFEYVCSVFTEVFFGTIFWDYSKIPFNINGRINLLFSLFWGLAAVLFIKHLYPFLTKWIERIPRKVGTIITNIVFILFIIDLAITGCVMMRYHARKNGVEATNIVEKLCDEHAPDEYMKKRWPNMKTAKKE